MKGFFFLIMIPSLLSGCLSLPTMQSGRTVGKNNLKFSVSGSFGKYSQNSLFDEEGEFDYKPVIGFKGQFGALEKLDIGLNIDHTSFLGPTIKYQYFGDKDSKFASSIGLEAGFNCGIFLFGNFTHYVTVPLYASFHPTEHFSVYLTPRYIYISEYIFAHPTGGQIGTGDHYNRVRGSYGILIGTNNKLALEVSNLGKDFYSPTQFSIGYNYIIRFKEK